jgi:uncharacterized protein
MSCGILHPPVALIYQGVLVYDVLLGIPDLLRRLPDGLYVPVDIKSGSGLEGTDEEEGEDGKPKKHYAVQLCLYVEILRRLGFAKENKGIILDIDKQETEYLLDQPRGIKAKETWWEFYETIKEEVKALIKQVKSNTPAMQSSCKMCPWYQSCKKWCKENDDLSCLPGLGRSRRDTICNDLKINKVSDMITLDISTLMERKKKEREFLSGLAEKSLSSFQRRASIVKVSLKPVLYQKVTFPAVSREIFFDIEDDPTQEFVYLHGAYERSAKGESFHAFVAKEHTRDGEAQAWKEFWEYIWSLPENDYAVYYYSHHEKSTYKHMLKKHPNVLTESQLEGFFEHPNVIDLYSKVIRSHSDWPLWSYSLKDIATYLGFTWRDETPSGALSIQWYNKFLETNDTAILNRILEYNEDDCKATMILKDALVRLNSEAKV